MNERDQESFYVVGGTVPIGSASYVTRQADRELLSSLLRGEFCYILTSRQMGKSSLMTRTAVRLRNSVLVSVVDLTTIGQDLDRETWYYSLLMELAGSLRIRQPLRAFWAEESALPPLQRWIEALRFILRQRETERLVIFIDEIDLVRTLPFSTAEFFAAIRACYNRRSEDPEFSRLTFCLLGVVNPSDLIADTRLTPFNIGRRIELHDFTAEESAVLESGLGEEELVRKAVLARILYWTGGHPYLTQHLCQRVVESGEVISPALVNRLCDTLFLSYKAREHDHNLVFVRDCLLKDETKPRNDKDLAALLDLYKQICDRCSVPDNKALEHVDMLRLSGVVKNEDGYLRVRNRIYACVFDQGWIREQMPGAEVRRQRAAFRRGVLRSALVAVVILAFVGSSALVALYQAKRANDNASRAESATYLANMNLIQLQWKKNNLPGVLASLEETRLMSKDRGFEWGYWNHLCHLEQKTLTGNMGGVSAVKFSPDGSLIVTTGRGGLGGIGSTATIWNAATGSEVLTVKGHSSHINSVAFSKDGRRFVTGSEDGTAIIWDTATGTGILTLKEHTSPNQTVAMKGHAVPIQSVAFSPDDKHIVTGSRDATATIWNAATGQILYTLKGHNEGEFVDLINWRGVTSAAFSPDGKRIVTGGCDKVAKVWNAATGTGILTLQGHTSPILSVAFSPDGRQIVTGGCDNVARVWNAATGQALYTLKGHDGWVSSVAFSPDGKHIVTGSWDTTARTWNAATGSEVLTLKGHDGWVSSVAFSPDGKRIVTGSGDPDHTARIWDAVKGREVLTLEGHHASVNAVAFSADGKRIVTGSVDNTAKVWDTVTGQEILTLTGHKAPVWAVALSPNGRHIVTGSRDATARVWDAMTGHELFTLKGHATNETERYGVSKPGVSSVAFSPDGKHIITGGWDHTVRVWDAMTGHELFTLKGKTGVYCVALSSNGRRIIIGYGGWNGTARVCDAITGRELLTLKGHTMGVLTVAFSNNGRYIVTGGEDSVAKVWDATTGTELRTLKGHSRLVSSVTFSPDDRRIVTGSADKTAKIWNAATGREVLTLEGHTNRITSVAFSPDGQRIVTGSEDKTARVWISDMSSPVDSRR